MASKPGILQLSYSIASRTDADPFVTRATQIYMPSGLLNGAITAYATSIPIDGIVEPGLITMNQILQIGDELVWVTAIAMEPDGVSGTLTVQRGVVDTVPAPHADNTVVFFTEDDIGGDTIEYVSGETVDVKLLSTTSTGTYPVGSAVTTTLPIVARQGRPYPPGRVMADGVYAFSATAANVGDKITWKHRDRIAQSDQIIDHTAMGSTPEPGVTYTLRIYRVDTGALQTTISGITGDEATIPSIPTRDYRFELESVRDGLVSFQKYVFTLSISP
jgi:hypothetical protein